MLPQDPMVPLRLDLRVSRRLCQQEHKRTDFRFQVSIRERCLTVPYAPLSNVVFKKEIDTVHL